MGDSMLNFSYDLVKHKIKEYKRGEIIKNEGTICEEVGLILYGSVSISNVTLNNEEFLIDNLNIGDFFGENLIFLDNNLYPGNIIASQTSQIIFFSKENFIKFLSLDNEFQLFYLNYISRKFMSIQRRIKILSQPRIRDKFLYYIQNEMLSTNKDYVIIKSITSLAAYLNIPRPSLSRTISDLINEEIITKHKKIYMINKN